MSGLIAIVGRPNVGKSALFNRIAGRRIAIVHDQPGVTRDRVSAEVEWHGRAFTLVDTGGIGLTRGEKTTEVIAQAAIDQVNLALEAAHVIVLVVNVQEGVVPLDQEVAVLLRQSNKPVLLAANKADTARFAQAASEFAELGFETLFPVSAIHGRGIDALLRAATGLLPESAAAEVQPESESERGSAPLPPPPQEPFKLAIIGRPNVGKSSIINALTRSERVIVSEIPGTTRDSVDVPFEVETDGARESFLLIDTAGMRKARRVDDSIEFFSVKRAEDSIERCDLCVLVVDAAIGITEQDKKIADKIVQARKACVVVINKWDLMEESVRKAQEEERDKRQQKGASRDRRPFMTTLGEFGQWVQEKLFFLDYAPVIFTSAKSGFHLDRLLEAVRYVSAQLRQKIPTALVNRALRDAVDARQPVSKQGHQLKFYYVTQVKLAPPTFLMFVNRVDLFSDQYKKFLAGEMRRAFGYEGCPVILVPKARPRTIEPIRKYGKKKKSAGSSVRRSPGVRPSRAQRVGKARRG